MINIYPHPMHEHEHMCHVKQMESASPVSAGPSSAQPAHQCHLWITPLATSRAPARTSVSPARPPTTPAAVEEHAHVGRVAAAAGAHCCRTAAGQKGWLGQMEQQIIVGALRFVHFSATSPVQQCARGSSAGPPSSGGLDCLAYNPPATTAAVLGVSPELLLPPLCTSSCSCRPPPRCWRG